MRGEKKYLTLEKVLGYVGPNGKALELNFSVLSLNIYANFLGILKYTEGFYLKYYYRLGNIKNVNKKFQNVNNKNKKKSTPFKGCWT